MKIRKTPTKTYRVHQWANDWITADEVPEEGVDWHPGNAKVLSPLQVVLEEEEIKTFLADYQRYTETPVDQRHHAGLFWAMWVLEEDGQFLPRPGGPR